MSMEKFYEEVYTRVKERIGSIGLSPEAQAKKLEQYEEMFGRDGFHMSALSTQNIATDLMTTYRWVITGEHEADELRCTVRNVLKNAENTLGNRDWVMAEEALRDTNIAYQQVSELRQPLPSFAAFRSGDTDGAFAELSEAFKSDPSLDFFEAIEKFFGVEVIRIKSPLAFDAIGAMTGDMPYIVVNTTHNAARILYATVCELAMLAGGNLALYSDVFAEDFPDNPVVLEFMDKFMAAVSLDRMVETYAPVEHQFPVGLVEAHREAVAKHRNLGFFLEWMTGEPTRNVLPDIDADHLIDLMD
jgi:hypothetical protein